ncbi:unnamed protein product [Protopolystoma xenopodis]|uniref:Large ribosomal subunit protein uL11 C-terminal domain-containing protein n=1 Tax=Protopolystoma xenopodis TaxID=117903 RepID=A0A3S5CHF6_9PLAT|nr:unnamed protein product [Protopolystoma xenopodis]
MVSLKHIYEIAKLKQSDPSLQSLSLESICKSIIGTAHLMGIQVLSKEQIDSKAVDYTPEGYAQFLDERNEQILQHRKALEEKKQAKMLRIS